MDLKSFAESLWSDEPSSSSGSGVQKSVPPGQVPCQVPGQVMDRASKHELVRTIEELKDQLQKYKAKLKDVVSAYKFLAKEKDALEASLAALSTSSSDAPSSVAQEKKPAADDETAEGQAAEPQGIQDPLGINQSTSEDVSQSQVAALKEQLKTLTVSLTTVNQEKSRVESNFVAANKQLRQENEELQSKLEEEGEQLLAKKKEFDQQTSELRGRIRGQQLEREKEQTDHVVMLRELQKLLAEERQQKEQMESQLDEARRSLQDQDKRSTASEQQEKRVKELSQELNKVRRALQHAERKANEPSPFVLDLQKEMAVTKAEHQQRLQQEQRNAAEAESRLQQQSNLSEERISSLEEKLSELSEVVGNYERLRFQDQQAIQKLKERLTQLDVENTALVQASGTLSGADVLGEEGLDPQALYDKILHLKTRLLSLNQQSERPVDISGLFHGSAERDSECPMCQHNKEELEQVKEEFERYKLRAQSVLKNKHKDSTMKEVDVLKDQVSDLRERLKMATVHNREEVEQMQVRVDGLTRSMQVQSDAHKAEVSHLKTAAQKEVFILELEAKKQRQRTVALLAEKDQEIEGLRAGASGGHRLDHDYYQQKLKDLSAGGTVDSDGLLRGEGSESDDAVAKLLSHPAAQGEAAILHFAQEKARQDVEVVGLRKHKHQLEGGLRELQHSLTLKEERWAEASGRLEEQIHKLERDKGREGANLEYIKNVFLKFLTYSDYHGRSQMLKAITTILQFSPSEKESVRSSTHLKF